MKPSRRFEMTIRDEKKFVESLWDWGFLRGCFGNTRIEPTDIDGFVERNGKFLVLETKLPGNPVPLGQKLTFEALRHTGVFSIIVVWGKKNHAEHVQVWTHEKVSEIKAADNETVKKIVFRWFKYADKS